MSVRLMNSVFYIPLPPMEKLVLLCLADHASDGGTNCFPSVSRVVLKTGLSRRGVQKVYRRLEAKGILIPVGQRKEGMTEYQIVVNGSEPSSQGERTLFAGGSEPCSREGANQSACGGERGSPEPSLTIIKPKSVSAEKQQTEGFDEFWKMYPKKIGRLEAVRAWRKVKPEEVPEIMRGLRCAIQTDQWLKENGQYIPHGATFLNKRRWEDELGCTNAEPEDRQEITTVRDIQPRRRP